MNNKRNYSKELDKVVLKNEQAGLTPTLLLQACCAPCSSACLERLRENFLVTVYYYNPNITESEEYEKRKEEEKRLIAEYNRQVEEQDFNGMHSTAKAHRIEILEAPYDPERFLAMSKGLEDVPEGGERCFRCYALRLGQTAKAAMEGGYDYFSTTLTISPLKNADKLNEIGEQIEESMRNRFLQDRQSGAAAIADEESDIDKDEDKDGVPKSLKIPQFLPSDFKKKNGYLRSIELSREFGLYRQNYCGCKFSRRQAEEKQKEAQLDKI